MSKRKLTTEEILELARKQNSTGDAEASPAGQESKPEAAEKTAAAPAAGAASPKSTKDILAAARAQAASPSPPAESASDSAAKPAAAAKSGATPKSTADILAAARAQAKGGAAEKPAAAKPAAAAKKSATAATMPEGERPSVQEMLKAVRGDTKSAPAAPAKQTLPPHPKRPAAKKAEPVTRRNFLVQLVATPFAAAWTAFAAATAFATLGMARFMMPNMLVEPPSKFKIGPPENYPLGTVSTKWKSEFKIWATHVEYNGQPMIYALSTVCTHLGCTPNWLEGEQKFKCPCHGSGFYADGFNFEGPAPRPLERYGIRLAPDGMLEVDKSVKFQFEKDQWDDPASFYPTA